MSKIDVNSWASDKEQLALSFAPSGLKAIFSRSFTVPPQAVALILEQEKEKCISQAGETVSDFEEAFLVKTQEISLDFQVCDILSLDNHSLEVDCTLLMKITPKETYLQLFRSNVVHGRENLSRYDLMRYFRRPLREGIEKFVAARTAEDLYKQDLKSDFESNLRKVLEASLFDSGLELLGLRGVSFYSESFERILEKERNRLVIQEEHKNKEMLHEMQKRLVLQEVNAAQEAEQLKQYLAYQGVLKELELRAEIKKKKKEEQLQTYEELYEKMGRDEVKALIFLLEDDKLKGELINNLIEKDMTSEQIEARRKNNDHKEMEERVAQLTDQLGELMKKQGKAVKQESRFRTKRVYVCCGQEVISFDPKTNRFPEQPKDVYDFQGKGLGYLRSVRVFEDGTLLVGGQKGLYLWRVEKDDLLKDFVFPKASQGRGGVNGALIYEDTLIASHSEQGIVAWDLLGLKAPRYLLEDAASEAESVRGIFLDGDKIYFSTDNRIACSQAPFEKVQYYRGSDSSITTFLVYEDMLLAGNTNGRILRWDLKDPNSPSELNLRKASAIYMIKVAELGGQPHLLIGSKDYSVQALSLATEKTLEFQTKDPIRWVDGSSDYIYGVDRSGYKTFVWSVDKPTQPILIWRTPDKVQDLVVVEERVK